MFSKCKIFLLCFPVLLIGTARAQLPKVTFAPHWLPQAQFAGYYVAQERGFYKEAGLDVEIIHPSANIQVTNMLREGRVDVISLFLITAISAKQQGLDLVNFAQISQHSAIYIVTKKSSGLDELSKLNGKRVGIWKSGFDEIPKALMSEKGYKVEWVPILSTVNLFMIDGIEAMTVMSYNEYDAIINCGVNEDELNVFPVADYGYDIPEDGLYCMASTFEERKEDMKKFFDATIKGWEFASANRSIALNIVLDRMKKAHIPANRAHQEWMLEKTLELIDLKNNNIKRGELLESDYKKAASIIKGLNYTYKDFYRLLTE